MMNVKTKSNQSYGELLKTEEWIQRRQQIIERDGNKCINCGSSIKLEVHHRQYHYNIQTGEFKKPWLYNENNLVTLCSECHQAGHKKYKVPVFNV